MRFTLQLGKESGGCLPRSKTICNRCTPMMANRPSISFIVREFREAIFAITFAIQIDPGRAILMATSESLPYVLPYTGATYRHTSQQIDTFEGNGISFGPCPIFTEISVRIASCERTNRLRFIDDGCGFRRANCDFWIRRRRAVVRREFRGEAFLGLRPGHHCYRIPRTIIKIRVFDFHTVSSDSRIIAIRSAIQFGSPIRHVSLPLPHNSMVQLHKGNLKRHFVGRFYCKTLNETATAPNSSLPSAVVNSRERKT
ncbi:MAG: hypothetical protein KCHDKBKB_01637 [Elusimicrobia bacterium]|nr:hypothetical protein [Elusimicrobiota bacterium]